MLKKARYGRNIVRMYKGELPLIAHQRVALLEQLKNNVDVCWEEPLALQTAQEAQMPLFG